MNKAESLFQELAARTDWERCERRSAMRVDLDGIRDLLSCLGDPHLQVPALHLAGSKGKGSTAQFLERGLRGAGLRTGLYLSPHLSHWSERIQLDGQPAPEELLVSAFSQVLALRQEQETFFDLMTAAALVVFAEAGCAYQVLETGLGGRLDSTNVVPSQAAILTAIELEHQDILGSDLESIAAEKVGIFHEHAHNWSALAADHPARAVALARCQEWNGHLRELPANAPCRADFPNPLPAMRRNFVLAQAVLRDLAENDAADHLESTDPTQLILPGRFESRQDASGRRVILDLAHTSTSLTQVLTAFRQQTQDQNTVIVLALREDKDADALAKILLAEKPAQESWYTTPAGDHPRSADPKQLAKSFQATPLALSDDLPPEPDILLVCGSTYLVGALRLHTEPCPLP